MPECSPIRRDNTEDLPVFERLTTAEGHNSEADIVWIHGGGNFDGESKDYAGSKIATRRLVGIAPGRRT